MSEQEDAFGWRQEGKALVRGVAAGAIVGIPLLYTMEMWWRGMTASPLHLLALLGLILVVNFLFSFLSGFRLEFSVREAISESLTSVGIGLVFSTGVLFLIGEVTFTEAWPDILGRVLIQTAVVSIGVMFANSQVRDKQRQGDEEHEQSPIGAEQDQHRDRDLLQLQQDLRDVAATLVGATILSLNLAPTEEIIMIAARLPPWHLLLVMFASLLLCYLILFASGFQKQAPHVASFFQNPLIETGMAYALSLAVSFILLWLVGMEEATSDLALCVAATVTLGLPAVVGGAAGRLII